MGKTKAQKACKQIGQSSDSLNWTISGSLFGSSWLRDRIHVTCIFFTTIVTWEATQNNCSFCIYNTETIALMRWVILKGLSWSQLYGNVKITKWWKCQSTSLLKMGEKQQQQQQLLWHKVCSQMFELKRSQQSRSCWIKCAFNWCFGWMSLYSKVIHCH